MTAFTALRGEAHSAVGAGAGVLDPVREQIHLAELHDAQRVKISDAGGLMSCHRLLQQGDALFGASRPRIHVTQRRQGRRSQKRVVTLLAQSPEPVNKNESAP
jgi:hypothetical protein